jgi:S1-C subfamily serine protease
MLALIRRLAVLVLPAMFALGAAAQPAPAPASAAEAPVSSSAQRIYERTRGRLVQVRTLLKTQDSQSSVGSGFLVSDDGHLITNYHVVSDYALQPERHRLVYADAEGHQGALQLLAIDVIHDLALLKPADANAFKGRGALGFRAEAPPRGARVFSLGNPLDVGFAVMEGSYNGLAERGFIPTLFFGGSLSPGMSGGPALDDGGQLVGINVAARRDGEQVSFLVPAEFAKVLLARGRAAAPMTAPAYPEVTRQLLAHQADLARRFVAQPWRSAGHPTYRIPVPQETFLRCWGQGSPQASKGLQFERSDCEMDSRVFITGSLSTGYLTVRHEAYDGRRLGVLRFAQRYSASFTNEFFGRSNRHRTAAQCKEETVDRGGLPLRALVCLSAYKKLPGLYDLSVLTATLDQPTAGAQGRFDAYGVSFDNALLLTRHYLEGYAWTAPKTVSP